MGDETLMIDEQPLPDCCKGTSAFYCVQCESIDVQAAADRAKKSKKKSKSQK